MSFVLFHTSLIVCLSAFVASGCGDGSRGRNDPLCEPGETQACVCADGSSGGQICLEDQSGWGPCDCGATAPDADADADAEIDAEIEGDDDAEVAGDGDIEGDDDADTHGELGHPFGTHGGYHPSGVIFPSTRSPAQLDETTFRFYEEWRERYLEEACEPGQYRVKTRPTTEAYTVSEGHGYGMLFAVLMAGAEPAAQEIFDGLFAYYHDHPSGVNPDLMAWAQNRDCENVRGNASATDGDLDIAFSLLLAHRQWGSGGEVGYLGEANRVIAAILESDIHPSGSVLVGDWARDPGEPQHRGTRPSDFMIDHFRVFAEETGESRWYDVVEKTYEVVAALQDDSAPETGLLPDFAVEAPTENPVPAPRDWLEGANDGRYGWNSCRVPWRLAMDYLLTGEPRSREAVHRLNAFFRSSTGDDPTEVVDGYELDGRPVGSSNAMAFLAPLAVAAMIEPGTGTNGPWLDALWSELETQSSEDYYADSIRLMAMIVVSGNWFEP